MKVSDLVKVGDKVLCIPHKCCGVSIVIEVNELFIIAKHLVHGEQIIYPDELEVVDASR